MKPTLLIISFFIATLAFSQSVVNSTGTYIADANFSLSYSIGELAVSTYSDSQNFLTQGLLQPNSVSTEIIQKKDNNNASVKYYPNPVSNILYMQSDVNIAYIQIFTAEGKLVAISNCNNKSIDTSNLKQGIYYAKSFNDAKSLINTIKLIKN